jgi:hypothetical protein
VTSSARPDLVAKRSALAELWRAVGRERALISLFDLGRQKSRDLRAARLYAFGVFASYALLIALSRGSARQQLTQSYVRSALVTLSWVVGALASLGSARVLAEHSEHAGLTALALQRGFSDGALLRARTLATAERIARLIALPALLLVAVGLARGATLRWALAIAPAVLSYACALGLTLSVLAMLSAELAPRHPRALLLGLVLCPLLFSQAYSTIPSLPGLFSILLSRLLETGAAL